MTSFHKWDLHEQWKSMLLWDDMMSCPCVFLIRRRVRLLIEMLEEQTEALISDLLLLCLTHRNQLNQEDRMLHFRPTTFHIASPAVLENECCSGASQIDLISLVSSNTNSLFSSFSSPVTVYSLFEAPRRNLSILNTEHSWGMRRRGRKISRVNARSRSAGMGLIWIWLGVQERVPGQERR